MSAKAHILVVEDELTSRSILAGYFKKEGYRITEAENGEQMRAAFAKGDIDLIMLDIRLPDEDGLSLLAEVRKQSDVGVIMVTGKTDEVDRIVALEMQADDYVIKPFNPRELLARAKNILRRTNQARREEEETGQIHFAGWTLDMIQRKLFDPAGESIHLTRGEFELLHAFASHPGRVLTRDNLLEYVNHRDWDPTDRTVDVLVARVRRKIEEDPKAPMLIVTVHGVGYVFTGGPKSA